MVDELHLIIGPVTVGDGQRPGIIKPGDLEVLDATQLHGSPDVLLRYATRA